MKILKLLQQWVDKIGTFRIRTDDKSYLYPAFIIEVKGPLKWHIVKVFVSYDKRYARNCAYELLEMLEQEIEPTTTNK